MLKRGVIVGLSVYEVTNFYMIITAMKVMFKICSGAKSFQILERLKDRIEDIHKT